jgi:hypothetical protein
MMLRVIESNYSYFSMSPAGLESCVHHPGVACLITQYLPFCDLYLQVDSQHQKLHQLKKSVKKKSIYV